MIYNIIDKAYLHKHITEFIFIDSDFSGGSWSEENFLAELPEKWKFSLTMLVDNHIAGYIIASKKENCIHIHRFNLKNDLRFKGLGKQLLKEFEHRCKQQNEYSLSLKVANENKQAIDFYKKQNFIEADNLGGNIVMEKKLQKIVAIHQPNLFPWLGFFSKMKCCDVFVFLDHVENRPNDAIRTKRVAIINNKEIFWLTVPLLKPKAVEFVRICDMQINVGENFKKKHLKTIEQNYKKKPFYDEVIPAVHEFYATEEVSIAKRNIQFIRILSRQLNFFTPQIISSDYSFNKNSTDLLIEISKFVGADVYLAGGGAKNYQEDEKFAEAGIGVQYQNFKHPEYNQFSDSPFVPGLSVIDALMNIGFEGVANLLEESNQQSDSPSNNPPD